MWYLQVISGLRISFTFQSSLKCVFFFACQFTRLSTVPVPALQDYEGRLSVISGSEVQKGGVRVSVGGSSTRSDPVTIRGQPYAEVQRYLMQFSYGELTKADGIGFVLLENIDLVTVKADSRDFSHEYLNVFGFLTPFLKKSFVIYLWSLSPSPLELSSGSPREFHAPKISKRLQPGSLVSPLAWKRTWCPKLLYLWITDDNSRQAWVGNIDCAWQGSMRWFLPLSHWGLCLRESTRAHLHASVWWHSQGKEARESVTSRWLDWNGDWPGEPLAERKQKRHGIKHWAHWSYQSLYSKKRRY